MHTRYTNWFNCPIYSTSVQNKHNLKLKVGIVKGEGYFQLDDTQTESLTFALLELLLRS